MQNKITFKADETGPNTIGKGSEITRYTPHYDRGQFFKMSVSRAHVATQDHLVDFDQLTVFEDKTLFKVSEVDSEFWLDPSN